MSNQGSIPQAANVLQSEKKVVHVLNIIYGFGCLHITRPTQVPSFQKFSQRPETDP